MSEVSVFLETIYKLSAAYKFGEAEEYIERSITFLSDVKNYSAIDSILYSIDFIKVKVKVVKVLIYQSRMIQDKLIMQKDFVQRAIDHFGKERLI